AIFKTNVNTYTPLISNDRGDWIAYVTKRDKPDLKDWEKQKTSLLKQARDSAEQMRLSQWYMGIKKNITVVDNRKKFFDL
ncbi:MAG TPA: hypothetical protein PKK33_04500, partial [Candidatus Cloacimonadota bacterium]|nr:hypothetical protein [Candidatus Cloacimonadota bacterium]